MLNTFYSWILQCRAFFPESILKVTITIQYRYIDFFFKEIIDIALDNIVKRLAMITLKDDLDKVVSILHDIFELPGIQRKYDESFGQISNILKRYDINENPKNLRVMYTLCMQQFFESIPEDKWRLNDPLFIKESEEFGIIKFKEWIIEQIT